jgi:hypothetical protein
VRGVTCGVWSTRRGLVAAVVDDAGRVIWSGVAAPDDDARWMLLSHLDAEVGLDYELVLPDGLARSDNVARLAMERGIALWVVPQSLVDSVRIVGRLGAGPPARTAAALARLPLAKALRGQLRRCAPADRRQLSLL